MIGDWLLSFTSLIKRQKADQIIIMINIRKIIFFFFLKNFKKKLNFAYNYLKDHNKINEIYELKEKLQKIHFNNDFEKIHKIFPNSDADIYSSLYQFIYSRIINRSLFTSRVMLSIAFKKKFYYPLPKIYLDKISKVVDVNYFISKILYISFIILYFIFQIFLIISSIKYFFKFKIKTNKAIYLNSIPNLYSDYSNNNECLDFFKWSLKTFDLKDNIIFTHSNKNIINKKIHVNDKFYETYYLKHPVAFFLNISNILSFFVALIKTTKTISKTFYYKKFEIIFLIKEIYFLHLFKDINRYYNLCLFNNSDMIFKPLWTYQNEKKIKESVVVYFYSTNVNPLLWELTKEKYFETYGYCLLSWKKYVSWTLLHEKWLNKITKKQNKFIRTSYVPFAGEHTKLSFKKKILTIFDVPPRKDEIYNLLDNPYNIYTLKYCTNFIQNIIYALPESFYENFNIIIKSKFKNNKIIHTKYDQYLNDLQKNKNIKIIHKISSESIIDKSDATISIPFTSPAITSLRKNKNAIFYDPSGKLTLLNCLEKDIKLVSTLEDLKVWISELVENENKK